MRAKKDNLTSTKFKLSIEADSTELSKIKELAVRRLAPGAKVTGFRGGKAPLGLIEKNLSPSALQEEFLDLAINQLYARALADLKLRPSTSPAITITKFVPFVDLSFTAEVEAAEVIRLADYRKIGHNRTVVKVTTKDINSVLSQLQTRHAKREEVTRASQLKDEVVIDFEGFDAVSKQPINGTSGKDYPLILGSNSFIPGFETFLVGLKATEQKEFVVSMPKDYFAKSLQNRKISFKVTVKKVSKLVLPELNNKFAASIGPFKTIDDLKQDIRKTLQEQREQENQRAFENELLQKIADASEVSIPDVLIEDQANNMDQQERQNLSFQGQTWQEHLELEGVTEEEHRARNLPIAEQQVKVSLLLSEIAEKEKITVAPEELKQRLISLKSRYSDTKMQAELDKEENQRQILSQLLTEKTIAKLSEFAKNNN